jgi:hypothetical protein
MQGQGAVDRPPPHRTAEVVRTRRIEVVDGAGTPRVLIGRLGEGEGAVYGLAVQAGRAGTGVHLTADGTSAGLTMSREGEGLVDCRVLAGEEEPQAHVDIGAGGPLLSIEVAADGTLTVRLGGAHVVP